jgi:mannose-6-phosphate isomerase-like protein (cupin superfamily)
MFLATVLLALLAQAPAAQSPAVAPAAPSSANTSSVMISSEEIADTLKASIANNVVDQPIKAMDIVTPSGHRASLAMLRRTRAETNALIHNRVTEIYQITEGSGTLVTGGTLDGAQPTDLTRLNAGPSQTGTHKGGDSRHVKPNDVIIVPAGTPHRFSALDGPFITYLVYRFEPR